MEDEAMHPKVQLDVADMNHMELNNTDQVVDVFHDWSTVPQATTQTKIVPVCFEEQDKKRRSDSFSDEWQDYTTEVSINHLQVTPQHKPSELCNGDHFDTVDFTSMAKTVFHQCFHSSTHDNSCPHTDKFDLHSNL